MLDGAVTGAPAALTFVGGAATGELAGVPLAGVAGYNDTVGGTAGPCGPSKVGWAAGGGPEGSTGGVG